MLIDSCKTFKIEAKKENRVYFKAIAISINLNIKKYVFVVLVENYRLEASKKQEKILIAIWITCID